MARPKTKEELIELSSENCERLNRLADSFTLEEQLREFPEGTINRNIRDILAHLHQWHLMMLEWYQLGTQGEKPAIPAKDYTWKTLPELNRKIWEQYLNSSLENVRSAINSSFLHLLEIIESQLDEELFEKKRYKWTRTTSLGAYLISATSSHYDWAYKLIKKAKR